MNDGGDYLTIIPGVPSRAAVVPGMAHFAGTGPPGERCSDCEFHRYYRKGSEKWNQEMQAFTYRTYLYGGCEMFRKLTGRHGPAISAKSRACKYYNQNMSKANKGE